MPANRKGRFLPSQGAQVVFVYYLPFTGVRAHLTRTHLFPPFPIGCLIGPTALFLSLENQGHTERREHKESLTLFK